VRVERWPLKDFRHAFNLEDWPVEGVVGLADLQLTGPYHGPLGSGTLRIDQGAAWGETFDTVNGALTFNGTGLLISRIAMTKGPGRVSGSALIKWDGSYAFDAQGEKIPVETLTSFKVPSAPLSGVLQFTASGAGEFTAPRYEFKGRVADLFAGDQGVGEVSGVLQVNDKVLIISQLEASSSLLQASASGSIALNDAYDASLTLRFTDASLDPYLPIVAPKLAPKLSPYTRAKISGSVQVQGELKNWPALSVFATVGTASLRLFDYDLRNDGDVLLKFENDVATITHLKLVGEGTSLELKGDIPHAGTGVRVTADGEANLKILQAFPGFANLASSGAATVHAAIGDQFAISGQATITDGRLRHRSFPHGIDQINGPIGFDAQSISLDKLRGRMGEGDVAFGGTITLNDGGSFDLTAQGRSMGLRIPTGFKSTVDASLTLRGPFSAPTLGGDVTVLRSVYQEEIDSEVALLGLAALGGGVPPAESALSADSTFPLRLNVNVRAPGTLAIDTRLAQITGSANLTFSGTVERPSIIGLVTIDRGNMFVNGNRYTIRPGEVRFSNPSRLEPFFDVEAGTRARLAGQPYDVTIRITGTADKLVPQFTSDPFLPTVDLLQLLLGEQPDPATAERRQSQSSQLSQQQLMRTAAAQIMIMPISSRVGSVVQRTIPCDNFSVVPLLGTEATLQQGARVTCSKRISNRVFLTYSHAVSVAQSGNYDVVLLEYEQSDRVSWVLSRNEDRSFSLDFRIRHVF
jgi:translocation and assembly module TamB